MDFVSAGLADGRWFPTLTVLDLYTRESLALAADRSLTGVKVATALNRALQRRSAPQAITVDNGLPWKSRRHSFSDLTPGPGYPRGRG